MDGSRTELLHNTNLNQHVVLTLDYSTQILYWINGSTRNPQWINLESSDVDGSNRAVIYNTSNDSPFHFRIFDILFANVKDIDFFSGAIYTSSPYITRLMVNNVSDNSRTYYIGNIVCDFNDNALNMKVISSQRQAQGMQIKIMYAALHAQ